MAKKTKKPTKKVETNKQQIKKRVTKTVYVHEETNGFAVAGFVCSLFIPLLGFVFGGIGLSKANSSEEGKGRGLSIAALAISGATLIIAIIVAITQSR